MAVVVSFFLVHFLCLSRDVCLGTASPDRLRSHGHERRLGIRGSLIGHESSALRNHNFTAGDGRGVLVRIRDNRGSLAHSVEVGGLDLGELILEGAQIDGVHVRILGLGDGAAGEGN